MRLLHYNSAGHLALTKDLVGPSIPVYAILSHTWGADNEEVNFGDLVNGTGEDKKGYAKIRFCGEKAASHGLHYFWIDTCCIDKSSSSELQEAINSMFRWYRNAVKCYVYLTDVSSPAVDPYYQTLELPCETAFRSSRWFTRGWTLQELIGPPSVEFYSGEGNLLGDKGSLEQLLHSITGIEMSILQGASPLQLDIDQRFKWIEKRRTSREEDMAYSLLGIFDVHMPLIYGEGRNSAFRRLREEINKLSAGPSEAQNNVIRKRNRVPLSCISCRHRKLKCDRSRPCDNCVKRGDSDACKYNAPSTRKKNPPSSSKSRSPEEMQNRVDRLENLILAMMNNSPETTAPTFSEAQARTDQSSQKEKDDQDGHDSDVEFVASSMGVMKINNEKNTYVSGSHWSAILSEISEVKKYLDDNKEWYDDSYQKLTATKEYDFAASARFFCEHIPANKDQILRSFPSKSTADRLLSRFFHIYNLDPSFQIIHGPTYQKQYYIHWTNPQHSTVSWLGLTYAMMMAALISYKRTKDQPVDYQGKTDDQLLQDYKSLTAQCLSLTDSSHPNNYGLETVLFYIIAELEKSMDPGSNVLMGVAIIVRMAMKNGYHRDSKYFPSITPFRGEMKRRVWALVQHWDLIISSTFGLPPIVRQEMINTNLPSNLYDDELEEGMGVLPTEQPLAEPTPISYIIYKSKLIAVGVEIVEEIQRLGKSSYDTVLALDHKLREVHNNIPPHLKMLAIQESNNAPSYLIIQRYILQIMYLRFLCVLHRSFSGESRFAHSERSSVESAMEILGYEDTLHTESKAGGRLTDANLFMTSFTPQDFFLAAMIVCLHIHQSMERERSGDISPVKKRELQHMIDTIERSRQFWDGFNDQSFEAFKASSVLAAMLGKIRGKVAPIHSNSGNQTANWNPASQLSYLRDTQMVGFDDNLFPSTDVFDNTFGGVFRPEDPQNAIDWNAWDQMVTTWPTGQDSNTNTDMWARRFDQTGGHAA